MCNTNKLSFNFENKIYYHDSSNEDILDIILPIENPTITKYKSDISESTVESFIYNAEIKLILTTETLKMPKINIYCNNRLTASRLKLKANKINILVFKTNSSGKSWSVKTCFIDQQKPTNNNIIHKGPRIIRQEDVGSLLGYSIKNDKVKKTVDSEIIKDKVEIYPNKFVIKINDIEIIAERV